MFERPLILALSLLPALRAAAVDPVCPSVQHSAQNGLQLLSVRQVPGSSELASWTAAVKGSEWRLGSDGSFKAYPRIEIPTTKLFTNTQEPCLSCDCSFMNREGRPTNCDLETNSRTMTQRWIRQNSSVLEVGARYGSNSCAIAYMQNQSGMAVSVDADRRVWDALESNRASHNCKFHTVHGLLGREDGKINEGGFGTFAAAGDSIAESSNGTVVPHWTLDDVQSRHGLRFDTAIFDCEGCAPYVFKDFPELATQLDTLIIEQHNAEEAGVVAHLLSEGWDMVDIAGRNRALVKNKDSRLLEEHSGELRNSTWLWDDTQCTSMGLTCRQVCARQQMHCDEASLVALNTEARVREAFASAGQSCERFVDENVAGYGSGPWSTGGACGYNSHSMWKANCGFGATCNYRLVCPCAA